MDLSRGKPIVEVTINGRGPYRFAMDTCAAATVIDADLATELGLAAAGETKIGDPSNPEGISATIHPIESLSIESAVFKEFNVVAWDRSPLYPGADRPRGVLGLPLFSKCLLQLNYPQGRVAMSKGELPEPDGKTVLAIAGEEQILGAMVTFDGRKVLAHIDSGATGDLMIPAEWASRLHFTEAPRAVGRARTVTGEHDVLEATLQGTFALGARAWTNPVVRLSPLLDGRDVINIGSGILREYVLTVDVAHSRLQLDRTTEATAQRATPASRRPFGVIMAPQGTAMREPLVVQKVVEHSPAEAAGLLGGDVIVRLNGRLVADMTPDEVRDVFLKAERLSLEVERGGKNLAIQVDRPAS
jgi:hypothetical protein